MADRVRAWRPTEEEVERIIAEMRPIIHEFAQRARRDIPR